MPERPAITWSASILTTRRSVRGKRSSSQQWQKHTTTCRESLVYNGFLVGALSGTGPSAREKRGKKKAGIQRTRLIALSASFVVPRPSGGLLRTPKRLSRYGAVLSDASEAGGCPFAGLSHCGGHPVIIYQEEPLAVGTLDGSPPMRINSGNNSLFRTAGKVDYSLDLIQG